MGVKDSESVSDGMFKWGRGKKRRGRREKDCKLGLILHRKVGVRGIWVKTSETTSRVHACTDTYTLGQTTCWVQGGLKEKRGHVAEKLKFSSGSLRTGRVRKSLANAGKGFAWTLQELQLVHI